MPIVRFDGSNDEMAVADMEKVMGPTLGRLKGEADAGVINKIVKDSLFN